MSSLAKSVSEKLGVLCRLYQFFSPYQLLTLYRSLIRPCMECTSHVWGGFHAELLNKIESKTFCLIDSPPLTLRRNVTSLDIFMLTALLNLLTACLPSPAASPHTIFYSFSSLFCPPTLCKGKPLSSLFLSFYW